MTVFSRWSYAHGHSDDKTFWHHWPHQIADEALPPAAKPIGPFGISTLHLTRRYLGKEWPMPVPNNPIDRRQVLKALAAIPVLASPLTGPARDERSTSSGSANTALPGAAHRPSAHAGHGLIGVL
ncbi:hypothetical protein [Dactylosporangium sp. NPDC051541]|uniref:hypothetical protein n=1 Tax=Dactylosporangium sp. NPDC051541 TaxID=3363977 RepID=UPI0037A91E71